MKINLKATIGLIFAIFLVSFSAQFGVENEFKIDLSPCGYTMIKDKFIEIHSDCKIIVEVGIMPKIEMENKLVKLTIPEGWKWRIIP